MARPSRVALLLPACEELQGEELRAALELDLREEGLSLAPIGELSPESDALVSVETACSGRGELTLHADFEGQHQSRRIELGEVPPPQRIRALSLALSELLAWFSRPPGPQEQPVDAPATPPAEPPAPPASAGQKRPQKSAASDEPAKPRPEASAANAPPAPETAPRDRIATSVRAPRGLRPWQVALAPELRVFESTALGGLRGVVRYARWSFGAHALTSTTSVPAGQVQTSTLHASLAYSWILWGAPEGSLLEAGPRLGAGHTFMTATASPNGHGASAHDTYLDAALAVRYSRQLGRSWRAGIGAELGYASGPIGYADDEVVASTAGVLGALFLDLTWEL